MDSPRIIFHVDLDAYYASLAIRRQPELKGRPVIIGPDPNKSGGRGVALTCSYEARKKGVRSGMPISRVQQLCPDAAYCRVDWDDIRETSQRIHAILESFADEGRYKPAGSDEGYLDVTNRSKEYNSPEELAREIQRAIMEQEQLGCSIGIGPTKLVAKIASDFRKPEGITNVDPGEVIEFLNPLPVRRIIGVGPKTENQLKKLKISTIKEIRKYDFDKLCRKIGYRSAEWLVRASRGESSSEIRSSGYGLFRTRKSIGHERTFPKDMNGWNEVETTVRKFTIDNCKRAKKHHLTFRTVTVKIRFQPFETHTKSVTFSKQTTSPLKAARAAIELLNIFHSQNPDKKVRLVGSRLSGIQKRQKSLSSWLQSC